MDTTDPLLAMKQTEPLIDIVPACADHLADVIELDGTAYDYGDQAVNDPYGGAEAGRIFLSQIKQFPEGQFAAIDRATGKVVGRTASMRYHFDLTHSLRESWAKSTGHG